MDAVTPDRRAPCTNGCCTARAMRELGDDARDALIAAAGDKVVDARARLAARAVLDDGPIWPGGYAG